ncbi:MAG: glycosyltransferase [Planctomycetes bacterium]|nr:glycosyltransferase [Planctomycetota bacterium]
MRFLLTTIGTVGDINGFLGVGDYLRKRGHDVTFITNPRYEGLVKKVGVDFIPVGDEAELTEFLDHPDFYKNSKGWKLCLQPLFLSPMKQQYEIVTENYVPNETVVVGSCWAFGARIAHEKLGVPMATIHLETQNVRSLCQTPLMPPPMVMRDWVPRFAKRIQYWIADRWFIDPRLVSATNEFRQSLGLPPVKRLLNGWWNSPQRIIGLYPDWFYPPQPDWPTQMVLTGFSNWDQAGATETPRELDEFLAEGTPPIVFYVGLNNIHAHRFFAAAAAERPGADHQRERPVHRAHGGRQAVRGG